MSVDQQPLQVPIPEHITMEQTAEGLTLTYRWFSWSFVFLAIFCFAWDGFLVFWYSLAFTQNAPWIMFVFPLIHLSAGIGLTYYTRAGFYNRIEEQLGIKDRPVEGELPR